ncbi:SAG family member [Eimeria brunetti]|uniref:SAG family member n=1 Tax=Eimeria brunetti TaxID=51314 RepID=U6LUF0_9EIME|nr:SAG family member [Eimeria brunetti]
MGVLKFLLAAAAAIFFIEAKWAYASSEGDQNKDQTAPNESEDQSNQNGAENGSDGEQNGGGGDTEPEDVSNTAERVKCWEQMNTARSPVGFAKLTQENILNVPSDSTSTKNADAEYKEYLEKVCEVVKADKKLDGVATSVDGTIAYAVHEGKEADCQAAVDHWKEAFSKFNGLLPPVFTAGTPPYDSAHNISFLSLFNPQASPKVDCAYFTCPAAQNADTQQRNTDTEKGANALICITTPNALKTGEQPYKQDEWDQITAILNPSNAASAVPTALAFAAAVAALFL